MIEELIQLPYCYEYLVEQISVGLLLYSHIGTALVAILFGTFVAIKSRDRIALYLLLLTLTFGLWAVLDLFAWFAFLGASITMFVWSMLDFFAILFFLFAYWFLFSFSEGRDLPCRYKFLSLGLLLPTVLFIVLGTSTIAFDTTSCEVWESPLSTRYTLLALLTILFLIAKRLVRLVFRKHATGLDRKEASQMVLVHLGVFLFLATFFTAYSLTGIANSLGWIYAYNIEIYGLFGMPVLVGYLTFAIVKYHSFDLRILSVQALVVATVLLILVQFLYMRTPANIYLNGVTLVFVILFGYFIYRSTMKEIEQREKGEQLARYLANANARLRELDRQKTEFVSIASHQLRAPIAAITGYASLIADGSYGIMPDPMREPLFRIFESGKRISVMVDDFLNVTRMEQGRMTYATLPVDICKVVRDVTAEIALIADNRGLALEVTLPEHTDTPLVVTGDEGKLKQVLSNLIDNAVKYTKSGFVRVSVALPENKHSVLIGINDSGIGIAPEEIPNLFAKFSRATNANDATVTGTGLGLYIAKEIIKAHNGWIHVSSLGVGKGTTFTIEIPLAKVAKAR